MVFHPSDNVLRVLLMSSAVSAMFWMSAASENGNKNGTPEDSDLCINELINSNCGVSEKCWLSEVNGGFHSGYKTSHRLLYFQVAERMRCETLNPSKFNVTNAVKNKLCEQMLMEAKALSEESHFDSTQDLFMEEIALCGLEGHEEFAPEIWRGRVRDWQGRGGCFGRDLMRNCSAERGKRRERAAMMDECESHVTGVAMSALAFFLRVTLKEGFELI